MENMRNVEMSYEYEDPTKQLKELYKKLSIKDPIFQDLYNGMIYKENMKENSKKKESIYRQQIGR